jgi:hypothetical protein
MKVTIQYVWGMLGRSGNPTFVLPAQAGKTTLETGVSIFGVSIAEGFSESNNYGRQNGASSAARSTASLRPDLTKVL